MTFFVGSPQSQGSLAANYKKGGNGVPAFYFSVNGDKSDIGNPKQAIAALPLSLADCDAKNVTTH